MKAINAEMVDTTTTTIAMMAGTMIDEKKIEGTTKGGRIKQEKIEDIQIIVTIETFIADHLVIRHLAMMTMAVDSVGDRAVEVRDLVDVNEARLLPPQLRAHRGLHLRRNLRGREVEVVMNGGIVEAVS